MSATTGTRLRAVKRAPSAVFQNTAPTSLDSVDSMELTTSSSINSGIAIDREEESGKCNGKVTTIDGDFDDDLDSLSISPLEIEPARKQSWIGILADPSLRAGRFIVLGAAAIYGTNFATVKLLDDSMPLSISAALRFGLAAAALSALVLGRENSDVDPMVKKERSLAFWSGAEVGLWHSVAYLAQAEALHTIAAGKSAFFSSLAVMVVPILDVLLSSRTLQGNEIASVVLACAGVGLLEIGPKGFQISTGDMLAFMQTIFFGIGYWRLESVSHAHPNESGRVTVGQLNAIAGASLIYASTEFGLGHVDITVDLFKKWMGDPFIIGALLWTGLMSTALALYLETVSLKVVSATELTLLMTTTSLWGASFAYVTIGEVLSPTGLVGGLMILGGCVLGNLSSYRTTQKDKLETSHISNTGYNDLEQQE